MDFNMNPMYYFGIKGFDPLIFRMRERHVACINQLELVPLIEQSKQTQYLVRIPTFGLRQLVLIDPIEVHVQQATTTSLLVNIHVAIGLPICDNCVLL
jgi:hypothetical protein